jgi:DNA invertase Pin-like site-specific DNA recombinase
VKEVGSGASQRQLREKLLEAARRREIDAVLVWRLDRWGRSVTDLLATLQELEHLGVGFVSLTEATGPDHAVRSRDGWAVGRLRRLRTRDPG